MSDKGSALGNVNSPTLARCCAALLSTMLAWPWVGVAAGASEAPLLTAARAGRLAQADTLLAAGADPSASDAFGFTPLLLARLYGHHQTAALLRRNGAKLGLQALTLRLETGLAQLGYQPGPVDGRASTETRAAIIAFQRHEELAETGRIEELWVKRLQRRLLLALQPQLSARGWYQGIAHGLLDQATQQALSTARSHYQLPSHSTLSDLLALLRNDDSSGLDSHAIAGAATVAGVASDPPLALSATADAVLGQPPNDYTARGEIHGPLVVERRPDGTVSGCSLQDLAISYDWCEPFLNRPQNHHCQAVLRPNGALLALRCR